MLTVDPQVRFGAFLVFELVCGIYFPCFYSIRARIVPEEVRATVLNFYRIPMNILVLFICGSAGSLEVETMFFICTVQLALATVASFCLKWEEKDPRRASLPTSEEQMAAPTLTRLEQEAGGLEIPYGKKTVLEGKESL
eukprot:GHVU01056031.1.p3 GENE.GHVU01056031.1~~GHVU01056031.1.p3  ORF type:complete len:139 (-),score=15.57 GHVU01056031.1:473-889(-)